MSTGGSKKPSKKPSLLDKLKSRLSRIPEIRAKHGLPDEIRLLEGDESLSSAEDEAEQEFDDESVAAPDSTPRALPEESAAEPLEALADGANEVKILLVELNVYFVSLVRLCGGDFDQIREKANAWVAEKVTSVKEHVSGLQSTLDNAVEAQFAKLRAPIREALKKRVSMGEVDFHGVKITLTGSFDPSKVEDVDNAAKFILNKVKEQQDLLEKPLKEAWQKVQAGIENTEMLANETIQNLLGSSGDGSNVDPLIGNQIIGFLGTSASVAKAAADAIRVIEGVRRGRKEVTAAVSAQLDGAFSTYGSTLVEGKSFVDGINLAIDAGFLVEGTAKLTGEAKAQLSDEVYAIISAQAEAYFKAAGSFKGVATLGLFEGLTIAADASFEAQAAASASVEMTLAIGKLKMQGFAGAHASAGVEARASGRLVIKGNQVTLEGKANFKLGAEVTATAGLKVNEYFSISVKASAIAGLAGEVSGSFSIEGGKLKLSVNLGAALGAGGALGLDLEVDFKPILEEIARDIEAYLLTRWQHRHLDLGEKPPLLVDSIVAVQNVAAGLEGSVSQKEDFSACLQDPEIPGFDKSAMRALPIGTDEKFLEQLHLLCRGMWKRYESKVTAAIKKQAMGQLVPDVGRYVNEDWHLFNKGLADMANIQYGPVILVRYKESGGPMPLGKFTFEVPEGSFELTRVSADPDAVFAEFKNGVPEPEEMPDDGGDSAAWGQRDADLTLLTVAIAKKGLQANSKEGCDASLQQIANEYWKTYFAKHTDEHVSIQDNDAWWEEGGPGQRQTLQLNVFFNRLLESLYSVQPPKAGKSAKANFKVTPIGGDKEGVAKSYEARIRGIWSKMFTPTLTSGILVPSKLDRATAVQLRDVGVGTLDRWLGEVSNEAAQSNGLAQQFAEHADLLLAEIGKAFGVEKNVVNVRAKINALKPQISGQVTMIDEARAAYQELAIRIKDAYDTSNIITQEAYDSKVTDFKFDLLSYRGYDAAVAIDDEKGAASAKALAYVCEELLKRNKK